METDIDIKKKLLNQKILFFCCWAVVVGVYVIGKKGLLPFAGLVEPKGQIEYLLQIVAVALVLGDMYLGVKVFKCNPKTSVLHLIVAVICELSYFATNNRSFGIMALMVMSVTLLCYPTAKKFQDESDKTTIDK